MEITAMNISEARSFILIILSRVTHRVEVRKYVIPELIDMLKGRAKTMSDAEIAQFSPEMQEFLLECRNNKYSD